MMKILLVEDDANVRQNIQDLLEAENYDVRIAKNGREGLEVAYEVVPDLILCDVMMPEMDGHEFYRELSKDERMSHIPFVFLTAKADPADLREAMDMGADDYLTKPFTRDELLHALDTRLQKSRKIDKAYTEQFDELRTTIAVSLPHELRTPLTGIMGFSEYLLENIETTSREEIAEFLTHIHNSARRLNRLIENYITYSELQIKQYDEERAKRIVRPSLSLVEYLIQIAKTVAYEYERDEDLDLDIQDVDIAVSEKDLQKVCEELLGNAFRFSKKGQKVHMSSKAIGEVVEITIRDHGIGMEPGKVRSLGGFMQLDRDRNEQQGSGLGFTIARQLVELMGGSVKVESKPNYGTTVSFRLPIRHESA
ncbi:MAG: two-component signal transduction system fused histidine kinase / response regulator [Bacteroidetes bacterium HLUCCA01]|nr:MAG: two-component signal transduction system fused histidine kinase / response regulator [Bacteroidetes bacterium HLUCCA01]